MANVNIRKANKPDAKKIYDLMQQQAAEQKTVLPPHFTCEAVAEGGWGSTEVMVAFVAEDNSDKQRELQGYILAHRAYCCLSGRVMYIKEIYVVPAARRSGVAVLLCRELLQAALNMGCRECYVRLDKPNQASVGLFEKLGAQNVTKDKDWHIFSMDRNSMRDMVRCKDQGPIQVRPAAPEDMVDVMAMIHELADYERTVSKINVDTLVTDSSPSGTFFECFVAESDRTLVGYVLLYHTFSSQGRGVYMEDLYVKPTHRCQGVGSILMAQAVQRALTLGPNLLDFCVLSWNTRGIAFYKHRGAIDLTADRGVNVYRLVESDMRKCLEK